MQKTISILFIALIVSCTQTYNTPIDKFEIFRGTNIAHWLSQSARRGVERENFFTKKDVEQIASMGFDHIRLPVDEEQMWDEKGNRHADAFTLMENAIQWAGEFGLKVIIDLHILRSHHFNRGEKPLWTDPAEQEKFYDFWRDFSTALKKYPNSQVAYELMNEAVADDPNQWNELLANAYKVIRELEPERTIVIGSNRWQSVNTFDELVVPENDPNIILSFHFYEPFLLTHHHASWTYLKNYHGPVHYPGILLTTSEFELLPDSIKPVVEDWVGKESGKQMMFEQWAQPIAKANKLKLPLYCGEFGIITGTPEPDRLNWYTDMIQLFEENDIAYANWNYDSGSFGLVDGQNRNEKLIQIVSGK